MSAENGLQKGGGVSSWRRRERKRLEGTLQRAQSSCSGASKVNKWHKNETLHKQQHLQRERVNVESQAEMNEKAAVQFFQRSALHESGACARVQRRRQIFREERLERHAEINLGEFEATALGCIAQRVVFFEGARGDLAVQFKFGEAGYEAIKYFARVCVVRFTAVIVPGVCERTVEVSVGCISDRRHVLGTIFFGDETQEVGDSDHLSWGAA